MSFDYSEIAELAHELLQEFGSTGQIVRKEPSGEYDPGAGEFPVVEVSQAVTAAVFAYPAHLIDGTTVLQGDEQAYVSAVGLVMPAPAQVLTWQGKARTVISVKDLAPAGVSVLVELQVRA
ncbi:MAG: hypothetical protein EOP24_31935 [Hyphomicrobiales bacterium]|nr:MAG: hypothetical protein EOP24_31935 [Hyphomicrobiales bacterium]